MDEPNSADRELALGALRDLCEDSVSEEARLQAAQLLLYESKGGDGLEGGFDELADAIAAKVLEKLSPVQRAALETR